MSAVPFCSDQLGFCRVHGSIIPVQVGIPLVHTVSEPLLAEALLTCVPVKADLSFSYALLLLWRVPVSQDIGSRVHIWYPDFASVGCRVQL